MPPKKRHDINAMPELPSSIGVALMVSNSSNNNNTKSVQQQQQKPNEEPKWVFPPYQIDFQASLEAPRAVHQIKLLRTLPSPNNHNSSSTKTSSSSPSNSSASSPNFAGSSSSSSSSSQNHHHHHQPRIVAVKRLTLDLALTNWVRELRMANFKISHPNIVLYLACAPVSDIAQRQQQQIQQQNQMFSPTSISKTVTTTTSSIVGTSVELHMEYAERLCLGRFTEDLAFLIDQRKTKMLKRLMDEQQQSSTFLLNGGNNESNNNNEQPLFSPTKEQLKLAFSGIEPMIEACLKSVAKQGLIGLTTLHEIHEIQHRDIKPGNFLFFENGLVKLTDFEAAIPDHVSGTANVGTLKFQAPEVKSSCFKRQQRQLQQQQQQQQQQQNEQHSEESNVTKENNRKADIWSLGATLLISKMRLMFNNNSSTTSSSTDPMSLEEEEKYWPDWAKNVLRNLQEVLPPPSISSSASTSESEAQMLQHRQASLDATIEEVFVDPALRHLVKIMLRYNLAERASVLRSLAWTFALTHEVCENAEIVSELNAAVVSLSSQQQQLILKNYRDAIKKSKKQPGATTNNNKSSRFDFGWSAFNQSHRDLGAEVELKNRGIETCDELLAAKNNKNGTGSFSTLVNRVSEIEAALKKECSSVSKLMFLNNNQQVSNIELIQSLFYRRIWYRREVDEVETMKEIIALTPIPRK